MLGALSCTIGLGLDGTWIDIAKRGSPNRPLWPTPSELTMVARDYRDANFVDEAMLSFLRKDLESGCASQNMIVADVSTPEDRDDVVGSDHLARLLQAANSSFVHVSGSLPLTEFALATGLMRELDVTLYPVVGGERWSVGPTWCTYRRLHVEAHEDGRVTTVWRRD